jgi:transposase
MARGKNDVVDSKRICEYVFEKSYKLKPTNAINTSISNLKRLDSLREKLVSDRAGLITRMNEEIEMLELNETDFGIKIQRDTIEMLSEKIELIDTEMEIELTKDISIKKNFDLLNTIVGIGKITAYQLIITTENFIKFDNPRKYASYAGVAPFTKQSGKSEGRTKVSGLANKKVKSLLDMCARSAMLNDPELKLYYKRKVLEGKNNRLVRNAIRFKLLTRYFGYTSKTGKPSISGTGAIGQKASFYNQNIQVFSHLFQMNSCIQTYNSCTHNYHIIAFKIPIIFPIT